MILGVDAAHWPQPFNWLYANVVGNIVASGVLVIAAGVKVRAAWIKHLAHEKWVAQHVAEVNAAVTGTPAAPHPHLGQL